MRIETPQFIVNVEGAIFRKGRYLIIVRGAEESHAPGALSLPGGKVEYDEIGEEVLERVLKREILEEVGLKVDVLAYVESKAFVADDGEPVVDVVFLCAYLQGEPAVTLPDEVADVRWMTPQEVLAHPETPPWTRQSIEKAERVRLLERVNAS